MQWISKKGNSLKKILNNHKTFFIMKTLLVTIKTEDKKLQTRIMPLSEYRSIERCVEKGDRIEIDAYISDFFGHRGIVIDWMIVDEICITM